jgi:hypothetical protein
MNQRQNRSAGKLISAQACVDISGRHWAVQRTRRFDEAAARARAVRSALIQFSSATPEARCLRGATEPVMARGLVAEPTLAFCLAIRRTTARGRR